MPQEPKTKREWPGHSDDNTLYSHGLSGTLLARFFGLRRALHTGREQRREDRPGIMRTGNVTKLVKIFGVLISLTMAQLAMAQIQVGDNTHLSSGGTVTVGYAGSYGDDIQSTHGLQFGANGDIDGYYYNPNFVNFSITPYYNQGRANSNYQSLTDASGVAATANFFIGSHFPGSVSYRYDYNSTGTLGLPGTPDFTTQGNGQGFGVNWSALFPDWPTLSVGYQQGSGSGTLYGTDQETSSRNNNLNVHSGYSWDRFLINGYYDHSTLHSLFPEFLTGTGSSNNDSAGQDYGANVSRNIPWMNGQFSASYNHSYYASDYSDTVAQNTNNTYNTNTESATVSFHPTARLGLFANQMYTSNLSGYLNQGLNNGGLVGPIINLGLNSYSDTVGGGATYSFTPTLNGNFNATHYSQEYLGRTYEGTFLSGTVTYGRKFLNMFTFSGGVVDSSTGQGDNTVGFLGTLNYFRRLGQWETAGTFSYAQNVQSVLITETTSNYYYTANLHRRFSRRTQWTLAFNGNHSGLSTETVQSFHSETFSTTLSWGSLGVNANYAEGSGNSVVGSGGIVPIPPTSGILPADLVAYSAKNYGAGLTWTPIRNLVLAGTYSRAISDTLSTGIPSHNNTEILYSQVQYNLRRIGILAGYTRFTQGISATGVAPGTVTSFFGGITRWFNFF